MGIKGIYEEIGSVPRTSLAKLSIQTFEDKGRPLRLAIDISIWNFQAQSAQGGRNPALRLLYFRLLRLLSLSIQSVFVFDGPKRPLQKRGVTRGGYGGGGNHDERRMKTLIRLLGFETHQAPGEAEAECALLQKRGLVDAVWSEDVDTLMFGATLTLKGWSSEGAGNGPPTHVSIYDSKETKQASGLDPEGMILVALMSGGDYDTDGIPGCGAKRACEAARAGFGKKLCALDADDELGLQEWREELAHELRTNESKFFSRKSKAIVIPDDFPRKEILGYYTHPAMSSEVEVSRLKEKLVWDRQVSVAGLREYVEDVFAWTGKTGAKKMIRGLAPAMLVYKLRERYNRRRSSHNDLVLTAANEQDFVRDITGERQHFSTDGILELRIMYQPSFMVPWDLDAEIDNEEDGEDEDENNYENRSDPGSPSKTRSPVRRNLEIYDSTKLERIWIPRSIAMVGVPLKVQDYEDEKMLQEMGVTSPKKAKAKPAARKPARPKGGMQPGALDRFLKVSKPMQPQKEKSSSPIREPEKIDRRPSSPVWVAPLLEEQSSKSSREHEKPIIRGRSLTPVYEGPPPLQQKIEREGFIIQKSHSPNVRPRREYRKVPSQPVGTKQTTLSAFKITKSGKQQNSSQKGDSSPLRHHNTSFTSSVISDDEDEDPLNIPSSQGKKHPRNPTPPSRSPLNIKSSAPPPSSPAPAPSKKRAPLATSKTVIQDTSSEDEELPKLRSIFPQRKQKGFRKSISDLTAMIGSPSVLAPSDRREVIDLLSSPIASPKLEGRLPIPQFEERGIGREREKEKEKSKVEREMGGDGESPRRESLPMLTDDDSFHTARDSLPLPGSEATEGYTLPEDDYEDAPTPVPKLKQRKEVHETRTGNPFSFVATTGKQKRFMAPRESLPGAWKEYTEEEVAAEEKRGKNRSRFMRKSGVEVLDLTADTP